MKQIIYILIILTTYSCHAQSSGKTIVCGLVNSESVNFNSFSYSGIMYKEYTTDSTWVMSSIAVDSNGYFKKHFASNVRIELNTYYKDFYHSDTIIQTTKKDSIFLKFKIKPKEYIYTEESALKNITQGKLKILTADSTIYAWNNKINFTKEFGFQYDYQPENDDYEFQHKIDDYNWKIQEHLETINEKGWNTKLHKIIDSLINIKADQFWIENSIDLEQLKVPAPNKLPLQMKEAIAEKESEHKRLFGEYNSNEYTEEFILSQIDTSKNYQYIFLSEYWIAFNYEKMIPELIMRIINNKEIGLSNSADLIIGERIESGDLEYYGHGGVANDDLFKISGRSNHLLRRITAQDFGSVSMYSTTEELEKLQNRWAYWLYKLNSE